MAQAVVDHSLTGPELLNAAAAEVASWPSISASRARQVKWVVGEYTRALAHAEHPLADDAGAREVFAAEPVEVYLRLARTGQLRVRTAADPSRGSDNSEQTRLEVLRLLVTACGAEDFAERPPQPDPPSNSLAKPSGWSRRSSPLDQPSRRGNRQLKRASTSPGPGRDHMTSGSARRATRSASTSNPSGGPSRLPMCWRSSKPLRST